MRQIGLAAAHEVVDHADAEPALEQAVDHVAADEAGAAGDDGDGGRAVISRRPAPFGGDLTLSRAPPTQPERPPPQLRGTSCTTAPHIAALIINKEQSLMRVEVVSAGWRR